MAPPLMLLCHCRRKAYAFNLKLAAGRPPGLARIFLPAPPDHPGAAGTPVEGDAVTPDDRRELQDIELRVVTQQQIIAAGNAQAIHDWSYHNMLRALNTPRWLAAAMTITRRA